MQVYLNQFQAIFLGTTKKVDSGERISRLERVIQEHEKAKKFSIKKSFSHQRHNDSISSLSTSKAGRGGNESPRQKIMQLKLNSDRRFKNMKSKLFSSNRNTQPTSPAAKVVKNEVTLNSLAKTNLGAFLANDDNIEARPDYFLKEIVGVDSDHEHKLNQDKNTGSLPQLMHTSDDSYSIDDEILEAYHGKGASTTIA